MPNPNGTKDGLRFIIDVLKDAFALLREFGIAALFLLFLLWPEGINSLFNRAGFQEIGSSGWKWTRQLQESKAQTAQAGAAVSQVEKKLGELETRIQSLADAPSNQNAEQAVASILGDVARLRSETRAADQSVKESLLTQQRIIEKAAPSESIVGWLYLGHIDETKTRWDSDSPLNIVKIGPDLKKGQRLTLRNSAYLYGDSPGEHREGPIIMALQAGDQVEIIDEPGPGYSHAKAGGWFVWVRVRRV